MKARLLLRRGTFHQGITSFCLAPQPPSSTSCNTISRLTCPPLLPTRPGHCITTRAMSSSVPNEASSNLASSSCEPCKKGSPMMSQAEIEEHLASLNAAQEQEDAWKLIDVDGEQALSKAVAFKNFRYALAFANTIGSQAEEQKHHPRLTVEWGRVTVDWWTHAIGGLHRNDFVMAAKTQEAAETAEGRKQKK